MIDVFLSASVPLPDRNRHYFESADVLAIREAIKALVEIALPVGRITCGGHPAITPLLAFFVEEAGLDRDRLTIFQSRFFEGIFPEENTLFHNIKTTEIVGNDRDMSLHAMRKKMINSRPFKVAVFIGGMEGVKEEAKLFRETWPDAVMMPIASTGAAALDVFNSGDFPEIFKTTLTYTTLFRRYIIS